MTSAKFKCSDTVTNGNVNDRDFCAVFVLFGCALLLEGKLHIPKSSEVPVSYNFCEMTL